METIIYLQEQQLQELRPLSGFVHHGVGFHWEKENVVHAFTQFPDVAPSGRPVLVLFKKLTTEESLEDCAEYLPEIELQLNAEQNMPISKFICLFFQSGEAKAFLKNGNELIECAIKIIPLVKQNQPSSPEAYLQNKKVVLVGLGALGFRVCQQLAVAGVGRFSLFDFSRLDPTNIRYHAGGWQDLGRFKTTTAREMIFMRNHEAIVNTFEVDIMENSSLLERECQDADIIFCATANHISREQVNAISLSLQKTAVFARMVGLQVGGEVFRSRASNPNAPCFHCVHLTGKLFQESEENLFNSNILDNPSFDHGFSFEFTPISSFATQMIISNLLINSEYQIADPIHDYAFWGNKESQYLQKLWNLTHSDDINPPQMFRWLGLKLPKFRGCPVR